MNKCTDLIQTVHGVSLPCIGISQLPPATLATAQTAPPVSSAGQISQPLAGQLVGTQPPMVTITPQTQL